MSKLISEEIVEAITLGDKEGFMSAFQSALAAKVSDALEIKKVEIASTLIAPASSEVVEEEVEQIDEAKHSYEPKIHRNGEHEDPDTHPANGKPDAIVDIEDGRKALVFHNYDYKKGVGHGKHTYVRKTDGDDDYVYHNHPKVPAEKVKQDFTNLDEEVEQIDELKKSTLSSYYNKRADQYAEKETEILDKGLRPSREIKAIDKLERKHAKSKEGIGMERAASRMHAHTTGFEGRQKNPNNTPAVNAYYEKGKAYGKALKAVKKMYGEEVEEIDEAKKSETRISWRSRTPEEIEKSDKRLMKKGKLKITSAELEARARARRGEKSE